MNGTETKKGSAELRKFGLMFAGVLLVLFGLAIPVIRHGLVTSEWPAWPWVTALLVSAWAFVHPASLSLLYRPWMKFAALAQWINTRIIMLLLFYLLFLPIGLLLRLFGKDAMHRRFQAGSGSYRIKADARDSSHMENPW